MGKTTHAEVECWHEISVSGRQTTPPSAKQRTSPTRHINLYRAALHTGCEKTFLISGTIYGGAERNRKMRMCSEHELNNHLPTCSYKITVEIRLLNK